MDPSATIQTYSLFADWLSKFHTWPESIQALWLVAGPLTVLGVTEILGALPVWRGTRRGRLVYGVYETQDGRLLLYRDGTTALPSPEATETALLPERRASTSPRREEVGP